MSTDEHWKPKKCNAPDISSLSDDFVSKYTLRVIFHSAVPNDAVLRGLTVGYVRLVDKCTDEYRRGRSYLDKFVRSESDLRASILLRAAGHFETCINTMKRAINYLEALRRARSGPQISKNLAVFREANRIRVLRDAIEHTDQDIINGAIIPGAPHVLMVKENGLALGGEEVSYQDLVRWLEQLHDQARKLWEHFSQ